jgi:uncharacterized small protein (DUF1192 family)
MLRVHLEFNGSVMAELLTSWKEIAQYLGKGVRTVQRSERELGLPVRRPQQLNKHVIAAFPQELDEWVKNGVVAHQDIVAELRTQVSQLRTEIARLRAENDRLTPGAAGSKEKWRQITLPANRSTGPERNQDAGYFGGGCPLGALRRRHVERQFCQVRLAGNGFSNC